MHRHDHLLVADRHTTNGFMIHEIRRFNVSPYGKKHDQILPHTQAVLLTGESSRGRALFPVAAGWCGRCFIIGRRARVGSVLLFTFLHAAIAFNPDVYIWVEQRYSFSESNKAYMQATNFSLTGLQIKLNWAHPVDYPSTLAPPKIPIFRSVAIGQVKI